MGCFVALPVGLEDAPPEDTLRRRVPLELARFWAVN